MPLKISNELIDYYAPIKAVATANAMATFSSKDFLGMMSLENDRSLYLFHSSTAVDKAAPFTKVKIDGGVTAFSAMRLKGSDTFVFSYIKENKVLLCTTEKPSTLSASSFRAVNLAIIGYDNCTPVSLNITGMSGKAYISISMKDSGGRIKRLITNCTNFQTAAFPIASNFTKISTEVFGRSVKEAVDGMYTIGEYGERKQLLYTPILNVFGDTPPAPKRLLLPPTGGDTLCVCPLKNKVGTHLFVAGGGGIAFYHHSMQHDCEHTDDPNPVIIARDRAELSTAVSMSSFISGGKIFVYILSSTGDIFYSFAKYDEATDQAQEFSDILLMRKKCLYFRATEGRMFICEKDRLIYGKRDIESGAYRFKEAHFEAEAGEFTSFKGIQTKIITDKAGADVTIKSPNKINAYINGNYISFTTIKIKSDSSRVVDVVQYADSITAESFTVTCGDETDLVNPSEIYHGRLDEISTPEGLKNAKIRTVRGTSSPLLTQSIDNETLQSAAYAVRDLLACPAINSGNLRGMLLSNETGIATHRPMFAQVSFDGPTDKNAMLGGFWDDILYTLDDIFNKIYTIGKKVVKFVVNIVGEAVGFIIKIGKEIFKFVLDTAWKVLEALAKVLSYIGIPLDKVLDFLKFIFDTDAIVRERDTLKKLVKESITASKPTIQGVRDRAEEFLDDTIQSVAEWAGVAVPSDIESHGSSNQPEQTSQNMYMFDIIWRRFDITSVFDIPLNITPSGELAASADRLYRVFAANPMTDSGLLDPFNSIFDWAAGQTNEHSVGDIASSLKALAGMIAVPCLQFTKKIISAAMDFFSNVLDFIIQAADIKFHIPIISDILNMFGISDFSLLDMILLPAAFFIRIGQYFSSADKTFTNQNMLMSKAPNDTATKRIPDMKKRKQVLYCQIALFVIELGETAYTAVTSLTGKGSDWSKDHFVLSNLFSVGFTALDFSICFVSGEFYAPMGNDANPASEGYLILWYVKTSLSVVANIGGMLKFFKGGSNQETVVKYLRFAANLAFTVSAVIAFICECIAVDKARGMSCPADNDTHDFDSDREMFYIQVSGYMIDDIRNAIDGVMGMIDTLKTVCKPVGGETSTTPEVPSCADQVEMWVNIIRAVLSTVYASMQLGFGIKLVNV